MQVKPEEVLIYTVARRLESSHHVAVGASSAIPAAAAVLAQILNPSLRISLLGNEKHSAFTDGGRELFDCAAQGRIDTFFLSGVQIDGSANINLVGTGEYPRLRRRFAGSFGSAYLYHLVPRVILFCWSHNVRTLVEKVDFTSAAGPRDDGVFRPGGPVALLTDRCVFNYQRETRSFELTELHQGQSAQSVSEHTGFEYNIASNPSAAVLPDTDTLGVIRTELATRMRDVYPVFAKSVWP